MHYFCTLFDSFYLSKGLVMLDSLRMQLSDCHIYIFAFDKLSFNILLHLNLKNATVIPLEEFENKDLIRVKPTRTKAEYCWTCTSSIISYVFDKYMVQACTYLDADLFFYNSPVILTDELIDNKNVLITEHRFSGFAKLFEQKRAGRFCVQFITFTNTKNSREILDKWVNQCIDWCYARYEDGKFGDQKYLENWPEEYHNVHILEHPGGGIAPWNVAKYHFHKENKFFGIESRKSTRFEVIFFHFHFVRIGSDGYADLGWNRLRKDVVDLFYRPYIQKLIEKDEYLEDRYPDFKRQQSYPSGNGYKEKLKHVFKKVTRYNLLEIQAN